MEKIICNGLPVYYRYRPAEINPANALTIIFLHNAGTDHSIWSPLADKLAGDYHLIQIDWPGYGLRRSDPGRHALGDYADILTAFIARQGLASVVLVGNCLGSGAALEYCARVKGGGIQAMVLFNVLVPRTLGAAGKFLLSWSKSELGDLYQKLCRNLVVPRSLIGLVVKSQVINDNSIPVRAKQHLKKLYRDPRNIRNIGALVKGLTKSYHLDLMRLFDYFPPTMIIWGDKNRILPLACGRRFAEDFGPTEFRDANGGHLVMLEQPSICAEIIGRFIQSHVPPVSGKQKSTG